MYVCMNVSSCFQLLTLCSTNGRWIHVSGEIGEIMQIWWERNEVFREKPKPEQLFPPQISQPLTWNWTIPRYPLQILIKKSVHHNPFSNPTYSHPCASNYKHNHHLLISIRQHKSQDVKLYCCQCEMLSQHRRQHSNNLLSHISQPLDHN